MSSIRADGGAANPNTKGLRWALLGDIDAKPRTFRAKIGPSTKANGLGCASSCGRISFDASETEQTRSLGLDRCFIFDQRGTIKGWSASAANSVHILIRIRAQLYFVHARLSVVRAQTMTKQFLRRIVSDVLIVLVSVMMITTAATFLGEPIRSGIAGSIPVHSILRSKGDSQPLNPALRSFPRRSRDAGFVLLLCNGT